jgi:hypothetical protein
MTLCTLVDRYQHFKGTIILKYLMLTPFDIVEGCFVSSMEYSVGILYSEIGFYETVHILKYFCICYHIYVCVTMK